MEQRFGLPPLRFHDPDKKSGYAQQGKEAMWGHRQANKRHDSTVRALASQATPSPAKTPGELAELHRFQAPVRA